MKTGEKIRYLRTKNNITSKELSKILDISESSISLYENGKRTPSIELIIKIANFFNVSTDFLLGVSNNPIKVSQYDSEIDFSEILEDIITFLNTQNYVVFDGKDVEGNMVLILKKNLNCVLENMRLLINM
ncbi:MAG TPA: XRE family transcriptional regulator [Clostridiales bacterium]|nr:XRE family transcriptional regulator [Clostridiales bacterium]